MSEPVDLTIARFGRLEQSVTGLLAHAEQRFDAIEPALAKLVDALAAHDHRIEQIVERLDHLIE